MMTFTDLSDQYFQWWQSAATRYLEMFKQQPFFLQGLGFSLERSLEFKKMMEQVADEMWRNFRLPSLEEITRLGEKLNLLESQLVALKERDWAELDQLREVVTRIEAKMGSLTEDLARIKKAVAEVDPKLSALTAICEKLTRETRKKRGAAG
jgi:chromosome segregation ATPase